MNLWSKMRVTAVGLFVVAALASCGGGSGSAVQTPVPATQTVEWQLDGKGNAQFMTNDSQWCGGAFWTTVTQTHETQMSTVTATVNKISGASNYGYGIVFCQQDQNNFYLVEVAVNGQYCIYAKVGGTYTPITTWTAPHTAMINSGFGVTNVISVTQQSLHNFSVSFNGTQETQFSDTNFTGGVSGFYLQVGNSSSENFPSTALDVRFKMTSPVTYPTS